MKTAWILLMAGCGFQSRAAAVDSPGAVDAAPAPPDGGVSLTSCPASYTITTLPGPSRYRLIVNGHRAWEQSDACNQDAPAATHLVVIETPEELAAVKAFVQNPGAGLAGNALWIGAVQPITAVTPSDGWIGFDGKPLINGWGGTEPNDVGGTETNHEEQFVKMQPDKPYFIDITGTDNLSALCECDGKPIDPIAASLVDGYRPPP